MAKYQSDTDTESYRYDDSNYSSDASDTDLDIPQFNDKNAIQIAEYLDAKLHNINKKTHGVATGTDDSRIRHFQSPSAEKIWTPLSQSTPAEIQKTTTSQPKDILKAKSKLSKLSANANDTVHEKNDNEGDNYTEESTRGTSFNEDTPSKVKEKKVETKKDDQSSKELEELRKLKKYISSLPNGNLLLESKDLDTKPLKIVTEKEDKEGVAELESLRDQATRLTSQNSNLKEEVSILKEANSSLKGVIELKNGNIDDVNANVQSLKEKINEADDKQEEALKNLKALEEKLNELLGDADDKINPEKYPNLNFKGDNNRSVYEALELHSVDSLNLAKSHNTIKNILINLLIPFSEVKETIPKIARLLQNEDILCDFASRLHKLIYQQEFNISKFQNELNGNDKLRQCTSQMYNNVEILFKELDQNE